MPNPDPFLRPGLTPATDVELYASQASGTTTNISAAATATGSASVARVAALGRQFAVSSAGIVTIERTAGLRRSATATATGTASESHQFISGTGTTTPITATTTATGTASVTVELIAGQPTGDAGSSYGNALGTYHPQPTYLPRPKRCRCRKGRPSLECEIHCRLITRQRSEDELLLLSLV